MHLARVFDYDVVSLARVIAVSGSPDDGSWGAFVGAVDMLNPGGAVLSTLVQQWQGQLPSSLARNDKRKVKKTRQPTCPALNSLISDEEQYIDLWAAAGTAANAQRLDSTACEDLPDSDVGYGFEEEEEAGEGGGEGEGEGLEESVESQLDPTAQQLAKGIVLEADLMGEG